MSDGATLNIFPREMVFPILSSLEILMDGNPEPDLVAILESFQRAPLLRSLSLRSQIASDDVLEATFPWSQLTYLNFVSLPLTVVAARDILVQCTALEVARLCGLFDWYDEDDLPPPPLDICTLHNLRELYISARNFLGAVTIIQPLSLPLLESLSISSTDSPTSSLLALQARSHFPLAHLSLVRQEISPLELFSVLGVLSTLETLNIDCCSCITDTLFEMLTNLHTRAVTSLTLPRLKTLSIYPLTTDAVTGPAVAYMVESLVSRVGDPNGAFPLLRRLCLYRRHFYHSDYVAPRFASGVEQRLAAACATGFLVERYPREQ
jgi:hypothetical protein